MIAPLNEQKKYILQLLDMTKNTNIRSMGIFYSYQIYVYILNNDTIRIHNELTFYEIVMDKYEELRKIRLFCYVMENYHQKFLNYKEICKYHFGIPRE